MSKKSDIKRAQKESYYFQEISRLIRQIAVDEPQLNAVSISRVSLSSDNGSCTVFFLAPNGKQEFEDKLKILVLYKPSIRTALAKQFHGRYVPAIIFKYDDSYEKTEKINVLLDTLKKEGKL